jgi:hypothetical protein
MALNDVFINLRKNLYAPLLFFIPTSLVPENKKELLQSPEFEKIFNMAAMIPKSGKTYKLESVDGLMDILEKPSTLNENVFLLSDQKASLNTFQFNILFEKYQEQLKFYATIANWMANHVSDHCKIDDNIKGYFELQNDFFQYHLKEINSKFKVNVIVDSGLEEALQHVEKELPDFKELFQNNKGNLVGQNSGKVTKPRIKKKAKPPLITDEEARSFLLASVFNVADQHN